MSGYVVRTARSRVLVVLIAALSLALGGATVPAGAAGGEASISGRVVFPAGYDMARHQLRVSASRDALGSLGEPYLVQVVDIKVAIDGTFTLSGLDAGTSYVLRTGDITGQTVSGYFTGDGSPMVRDPAAALRAPAGSSVVLAPAASVVVEGFVAVPPGYSWARHNASVMIESPQNASEGAPWVSRGIATIDGEGLFEFWGLAAGESFRLRYADAASQTVSGYFVGEGYDTQWDPADALVLTAPNTEVFFQVRLAGVIEGEIVYPDGYNSGWHKGDVQAERTVMVDGEPVWALAAWASVQPDGTFTIKGLEPGVESRLFYRDHTQQTLSGYFPPHAVPYPEPTNDEAEAAMVPVPASGVGLAPALAVSVEGTVTFPEGYVYAGETRARVSAYRDDGAGSWELAKRIDVSSGGGFYLGLLRDGEEYLVHFEDPSGQLRDGYFAGDGAPMVTTTASARTVTAPRNDLVLTPDVVRLHGLIANVTPPRVTGTPAVGGSLTASPGKWTHAGAKFAYQWRRGTTAIAGATSSRYVVVPADLGKRLTVRVTAHTSDFGAASATSALTPNVRNGAALVANVAPSVRGKARLGVTLRARHGTWSRPGASYSYQWLRAGVAIKGARSSSYRAVKADVGRKLSVRVRAKAPGYATGTATSAVTAKIAKGKPKVTVKARSVRASKRARVVVRVKVAGVTKPAGKVRVAFGSRSKTVKLPAKAKGKVTVRLPKLRKGSYKVKVTFKPSTKAKRYIMKASSSRVRLRVK